MVVSEDGDEASANAFGETEIGASRCLENSHS